MVTLLATSSMFICFSPHLYSLLFNQLFILVLVFACTYFGHVHVFIPLFYTIVLHASPELWYVSIFAPRQVALGGWIQYFIILCFPTHFLMTGILVPDFVYIFMLF